jgi:hypothetical protein
MIVSLKPCIFAFFKYILISSPTTNHVRLFVVLEAQIVQRLLVRFQIPKTLPPILV